MFVSVILILITAFVIVMPLFVSRGAHPYHTNPGCPAKLLEMGQKPGWNSVDLKVTSNINIPGLIRPASSSGSPWLIFLCGNGGGQLSGGQNYLDHLSRTSAWGAEWGLAVWAMRGYDGVNGYPGKNSCLRDILAAHKYLTEKFDVRSDLFHMIGFSLGADFALLAAEKLINQDIPPRSLVLLSTQGQTKMKWKMRRKIWYSRWILPDYYNLQGAFDIVKLPILIVEAEADIKGNMHFILSQLRGEVEYLQLPDGQHSTSLRHARSLKKVCDWIESHNNRI